MPTIEYKILFEVRVLHDYYLFGMDPLDPGSSKVEKSYFDMAPAAQAARLQALQRRGRYDIGSDLDFFIGSAEAATLRDFRLRMIKTSTGFYVAMEVNSVTSAGGARRFRPAIRPSEDTELTFGISCASRTFGTISNVRLDRDLPNIYLFGNEGSHDGLSLSRPIAVLAAGKSYRMGDLALIKGKVHQASVDNSGDAKSWLPVPGGAFVHQDDRALPLKDESLTEWLRTVRPPEGQLMGLIRIRLKNGNGDLSPIDADGLLRTQFATGKVRPVHPVFELRFLGRSTYWRYRKMGGFSDDEVSVIKREAGKVLDRQGEYFVTKTPRQLARELPPFPGASPRFRIPNPPPTGSLRAADGKVFSEVYFNDVLSAT